MNDDVLVVQMGGNSVEYDFDVIKQAYVSLSQLANASACELVLTDLVNKGEMRDKISEVFEGYNKLNKAFHDVIIATANTLTKFDTSMEEIESLGRQ